MKKEGYSVANYQSTEKHPSQKKYRSVKVVKGNGGFGGPLIITPNETRNKIVYITGGGTKPEIVDKMLS